MMTLPTASPHPSLYRPRAISWGKPGEINCSLRVPPFPPLQLHRTTSIEFLVEGLATATMTLAAHVGVNRSRGSSKRVLIIWDLPFSSPLYRSTRTRSSTNCAPLPKSQASTTSFQAMRSRAKHLIPRDMRVARRFPSSVSQRSAPCPRPWRRCSRTSWIWMGFRI
jgi:hypothetical protein